MSLAVVIKAPSGLVLAADSRVTLGVTNQATSESFPVHYDNATKLLRFNPPNSFVAAATYGQAVIPGHDRTAENFLPEFEAGMGDKRLSVGAFGKRFSDFYAEQWKDVKEYKGPPMLFVMAGYDEGAPYGRVFQFSLPQQPKPRETWPKSGEFGIVWGGQMETVDRMVKGWRLGLPERIAERLGLSDEQKAKIMEVLGEEQTIFPLQAMGLQDCVDLAILLIQSTISLQRLAVTLRGVGGPVDVVTITRTDGLRGVQLKEIIGEAVASRR